MNAYPELSGLLVGDIGGTNGRLAHYDGEQLVDFKALPCADHDSFQGLITAYLDQIDGPRPEHAVFSVATHESEGVIEFTNIGWRFTLESLNQSLGFKSLKLVNDWTSFALATPVLSGDQIVKIGEQGQIVENAAKALIGPGTGLGVSGLIRHEGQWVPLQGLGGHVAMSSCDEMDQEILQTIQRNIPYISGDVLLSGQGLVRIYQALSEIHQKTPQFTTPAEIVEYGLSNKDKCSEQTLISFCRFLGSAAGDLALTLGARGGVYLGGGVTNHLSDIITTTSHFREAFDNKGVVSGFLSEIPCFLLNEPKIGLLGAVQAQRVIYRQIGQTISR